LAIMSANVSAEAEPKDRLSAIMDAVVKTSFLNLINFSYISLWKDPY
jgi:hypothetical protein